MGEIEKESLDEDRAAVRRGDALQRRAVPPVPYKKYTDVRLVFAPETAIASFGGDVDNFEYPRMNLDVAFFRAYEDDKPAKTPHFFKWSETGPAEGDLVFVTGHPGTTNRLETLAKLKHRRDHTLPYTLYRLRTLEAALIQYGEQSAGEAAAGRDRPAQRRQRPQGVQRAAPGLARPEDHRAEAEGRAQLISTRPTSEPRGRSPASRRAVDRSVRHVMNALEAIETTQAKLRTFEKEYLLLEPGHAFFSPLFTIARHCVRLADELPKKSADRLREYRDSQPRIAEVPALQPGPALPGTGAREADRVAHVPGREPRRRTPDW